MGKKARLREKTSDGTVVLDLIATYDEDGNRIKDTYSKKLYEHNIKIYYATYNFIVTFKFINNDSTEYCYDGTTSPVKTGYKELAKALYNAGYTSQTTLCTANGIWGITNGSQNLIIGVYGYNNNTNDIRLYFRYVSLVTYSSGTATINTSINENGTYYALSNSFTIKDKVRTL